VVQPGAGDLSDQMVWVWREQGEKGKFKKNCEEDYALPRFFLEFFLENGVSVLMAGDLKMLYITLTGVYTVCMKI